MERVRDNSNVNIIYLVEKMDLKDILETGNIKESENYDNLQNKVYLLKESDESSEEQIRVLILKNRQTNKLSDNIEKINNLIMHGMESSEYELKKMAIDKYLEKKYEMIKRMRGQKVDYVDTQLERIEEQIVDRIIKEIYDYSINSFSQKKAENYLKEKIKTIVSVEGNNQTLIISEKQNKIYLPYTIDELEEYLKNYPTSYISLQKVVEDEFVIPFASFYKHPFQSRFTETYNLMKNKERKSSISALVYATATATKHKLNPAIIAACKSKDELNSYMKCLKSNRLDKFKPFEIIYEIASA